MRRDLRPVSFLLATLALPAALAGAPAATDPAYLALRAARPHGKGLAVTNLTLKRDVLELQFASGTFDPLPAVEGRVWGAVFVGQGTLKLSPASEAERRQLALVTGESGLQALSEPFESLVLLFSDATFQEIEKGATPAAAPPGGGAVFEDFLQKERKTLKTNLHLRVLRDLLRKADPGEGFFLAIVPGKKYPAVLAAVDPAGLDWVTTGLGGETTALLTVENEGSIWYSSASKAALDAGKASPERALARAENYTIDTEIRSNSEIRATTTIRFQPLAPGLRVLPLHLLAKLRVRDASFASAEAGPWTAAAVVQEADKEDADVAVVFPAPLSPGQAVWLRVAYDGKDVLHAAGDGNFVVEARESWYPNLATFTEMATFDLTFRCPKAYDVVSVGSPAENRVEGDIRVAHWKAPHPIRVAGFNYGKFRKLERADKDSGMKVEVYTNPGTPDIVQEINGLLRARAGQTGAGISSGPGSPLDYEGATVGLTSLHVDTEGLADSAMADGINTVRVCTRFFGPLPETRLSITQQTQWNFGQSWPSLVFLPYLAALDGTTRRELGLKDTADFVELVGPHEVAHQWWGHLVGWQNYRDQWLSEGFAEFSASLVLEIGGGAKKFHAFWEKTRRQILARPPQSAVTNDQAGAMTQGWRLATKRSPGAYQAMVYGKGAYVLHMLQLMMREAGTDADANFIAIMRDFVKTYAGKNPSTRDFQTVVERHMVPNMNGGGDGKMDWFFRQWVYGTEIPRYREKLAVAKSGDGQYHITGTVAQEGVSADFRALTHLYLDYGKGEITHLGLLPMIGSSTRPVDVTVKLAKAPNRAFLNANHDILSRD